jgi:hypothetical protein
MSRQSYVVCHLRVLVTLVCRMSHRLSQVTCYLTCYLSHVMCVQIRFEIEEWGAKRPITRLSGLSLSTFLCMYAGEGGLDDASRLSPLASRISPLASPLSPKS